MAPFSSGSENGMGECDPATRSTGASRSSKPCSWIWDAISAPNPPKRAALVDHHGVVRFVYGGQDGVHVERIERADVDHLDIDALAGQLLGGLQRVVHLAGVGHDADVGALALHVGHAERNGVFILGHGAAHGVDGLVLEEYDHVVLANGRFQQALGVVGRRAGDHLEPRHVREPGFEALSVLRRVAGSGAEGRAVGDGQLGGAAEHIAVLGGLVDDLVHGDAHEVRVHELGHGPAAGHGGANRRPADGRFGDGRVDDARLAPLLQQAGGDVIGPAPDADFLAHDEHVGVTRHLLVQGFVQRLAHEDLAGGGSGRGVGRAGDSHG